MELVKPLAMHKVDVNCQNGRTVRITALEEGIFRIQIDPSGQYSMYAMPRSQTHKAHIQAQPDTSALYSKPHIHLECLQEGVCLKFGSISVVVDRKDGRFKILRKEEVILEERNPVLIQDGCCTQTLFSSESERFFGGGMQNGRYMHKGKVIHIVNEGKWTDGHVASPCPFYWSSKGYGVLRNTFAQGVYDFTQKDTVQTAHEEERFDAYYFMDEKKQDLRETASVLLNLYYTVTGHPVLLPLVAFYPAHLNCYNRDGWKPAGKKMWKLEDGNWYEEMGQNYAYEIPEGTMVESLNNIAPTVLTEQFHGVINEETYKYSARAVLDGYRDNDMPLGWFLPNDGYGSGYGQNGYRMKRTQEEIENKDYVRAEEAVKANVENLRLFEEYARSMGVVTGLWTQAALTIEDSEKDKQYQGFHTLRDFEKEVQIGGVRALKTDEEWVGEGYSMALNSVQTGYQILAKTHERPLLVSMDGWAGSHRYTAIWSGDQNGDDFEYIRFHVPTYIGAGLSGLINVGSDMDGIYGGNSFVMTRDFEWKTFTPIQLNMDGWGSLARKPYYCGDPFTGIDRMYLKLKTQLMPYLYTEAYKAITGLPMIRGMFFEEHAPGSVYEETMSYQFEYGDAFLIAPIYKNTQMKENGDDVRDDIWLPDSADWWIDYFTGRKYKGGTTLQKFDAPLWKLPLFVRDGSIVPMYASHNNPQPITDSNPMGLDRSIRIAEFWPNGYSTYECIEDDGKTLNCSEGRRDYGTNVKTCFTSVVDEDFLEVHVEQAKGSYAGFEANRKTELLIHVSVLPTSVSLERNEEPLLIKKVGSKQEYEEKKYVEPIWYFEETPDLNRYCKEEDRTFREVKILTTPIVHVALPEVDVTQVAWTVLVEGFKNDTQG